jgi:hypothetical protein
MYLYKKRINTYMLRIETSLFFTLLFKKIGTDLEKKRSQEKKKHVWLINL